MPDPFELNILGVQNLLNSDTNKVLDVSGLQEGVDGELEDALTLKMEDKDLLDLAKGWDNKSAAYTSGIKVRQERNKLYYQGMQMNANGVSAREVPVASNLIFEAEETFIPQALSKNPEPVVWSDNTEEGKMSSNDIKTMLQFHADILCLRKKLGVAVRHWSIYLVGVLKHGWDERVNDITTEIRKPSNFILDPDGYIDEYGNYVGNFLGEKIESTAQDLADLFPSKAAYIKEKASNKMGTNVTRTEWWTNEYSFTTFEDEVLDKHKNEFFNYDTETDELGDDGLPQGAIKGKNHFARPKMPYTFLSVYSLQEQPYDVTNLIEQNIANQDRITMTDAMIDKNIYHGNNAIAVSDLGFTSETAAEAANALEKGDPVLVSGAIKDSIMRIPANPLPSGLLQAQEVAKTSLRSVFGTQGLTAQQGDADQTARGMILNQSHDSTRIGGGIGDALEQVADNIFNWWVQLYYVFYDEPHYAAIMGNGRAVEYIELNMADENRKYVVSVAPNSMKPKDEISETNQAIELWNNKALDPLGLYKRLNDPDPMETAKRVSLWITNPQLYMQNYFPENAQQMPTDSANPPNPTDIAPQPAAADESLAANPAPSTLSQVPLNAGVATP